MQDTGEIYLNLLFILILCMLHAFLYSCMPLKFTMQIKNRDTYPEYYSIEISITFMYFNMQLFIRINYITFLFSIYENKTNYPISSNSHPSATAKKQYAASK